MHSSRFISSCDSLCRKASSWPNSTSTCSCQPLLLTAPISSSLTLISSSCAVCSCTPSIPGDGRVQSVQVSTQPCTAALTAHRCFQQCPATGHQSQINSYQSLTKLPLLFSYELCNYGPACTSSTTQPAKFPKFCIIFHIGKMPTGLTLLS